MKPLIYSLIFFGTSMLFGWDDSNQTLKTMFNSQMQNTLELTKKVSPELYNSIQPNLRDIKDGYITENKPTATFFYFFSTKGNLNQLSSFYIDVAKLKKTYTNLNAYAVLNGFPEDTTKFEKLLTDASKLSAAKYIKIKYLPYMYKRLNIKEVPVYAYAICPNSEYTLSKCDIQYVVRGNVGLGGLLELMSEKDNQFKEVFNALYDVN
ncbi:MAG: TrbC family F-type conjugative pilus assembly protein [Campylobacterales bacterium]|nr:TrbC family F-type conjugative pilus assembly protein [Campylobacterales bacterium]